MKDFETHPHAKNMLLYARDATESRKPWIRWQFRPDISGLWRDCFTHPRWHKDLEYRRKIKTHVVNGFEVPAPEGKPPPLGGYYYVADPTADYFCEKIMWDGDDFDMQYLDRGLVFMTEQAAVENAKAMCHLDPYQAAPKL